MFKLCKREFSSCTKLLNKKNASERYTEVMDKLINISKEPYEKKKWEESLALAKDALSIRRNALGRRGVIPSYMPLAKSKRAIEITEKFAGDEVPSAGAYQIETIRRRRYYNRVAAYEMPFLSKIADNYGEFKHPLKNGKIFKSIITSHMGNKHPMDEKAVMIFNTKSDAFKKNTNLSSKALHALRLLAGQRYNAYTDELKLTADSYATYAENESYIAVLLSRLIKTANEKANEFSSTPLDTRHCDLSGILLQRKEFLEFPKEWNKPQDALKRDNSNINTILDKLQNLL